MRPEPFEDDWPSDALEAAKGVLLGVFLGLVLWLTIVGIAMIAFATGAEANPRTVRTRIPVCQEDEPFLRGRGDFDGQRWARYQCVHQDRVR